MVLPLSKGVGYGKINITPPLLRRSKFPLIQFLWVFYFPRCFVEGFKQEVKRTSFSRFDNYSIADQSNSELEMAWTSVNKIVLWIMKSLVNRIFSKYS
jgi:hypothetical protein